MYITKGVRSEPPTVRNPKSKNDQNCHKTAKNPKQPNGQNPNGQKPQN